ncbi:putative ATP-dependent DNA ligase YkoU [compost metagenome]
MGLFLGTYLVEKHPALFTIERLVKNRGNKIYVDYLQHAAGKSLSAAYTPRAREFATVSTPLTWEEIRQGVDIRAYNLLTIEQRLAEKGDLIAHVNKQSLHAIVQFIS